MDDDEQFALGQQLQPPDINSIIFEGALKKKSPKSFALIPWQDRFVRLTQDGLFYYKKKDSPLTSYQGAIPLSCVSKVIVEPPGAKRKYRIDILLQEQYNRQFCFMAKSDAEMIQWHAVLESTLETCHQAQELKLTTNAAIPAAGSAPGKIWKNVKEKEKKNDQKKDGQTDEGTSKKTNTQLQFDQQQRQMVERYIQLSKPIYPLALPPPRVNMFESLKVLANCLFGGYRIEVQEQSLDLGSIFILGDPHYPMTHKSYLMHCAYSNNPFYGQALASMELLNLCSTGFPLFPQQIHCGQTKDAVYSIYHPPLRSGTDSLFAWLPRIEKFPEEVVAWIAAHIVLTLDFIHNFHSNHQDPTLQGSQWAHHPPVQFPTLSPETIFFDSQGQIRVCDLFLNPNPSLVSGIPEYSCPEVLCFDQQSTTASDYWRFGVLLYELVTGLPPFRPEESEEQLQDINGQVSEESLLKYREEIKSKLFSYQKDPENSISFPPFVSDELKLLIKSLLNCDPAQRLTDQLTIRSHPFFIKQSQKIHESITMAYIAECGEIIAREHPIPEIQLWDVFGLINAPKLPWVHQNIITELAKDPNTPPNLNFGAKPVPVQRLNLSVKRIRGLMNSWQRVAMSKMQLQVTVEGDTQRGTQPVQIEKNSDVALFNENMTFDLMHGEDLSISSEIVIEVLTQVTSTTGYGAQQQKNTSNKMIGLVTFPLYEVRNLGNINAWLMIYDHTGTPIGELEVDLVWEHEDIELSPQTLGELTDATRTFQELFAKPSPIPPRKLWASVVDISTLAQYESSGATGDDNNNNQNNNNQNNNNKQQQQQQQNDKNNNTLHSSQLNLAMSQQTMNTMRGTFVGTGPGTPNLGPNGGRDTMVLGRDTINGTPNTRSNDLQNIYQPPGGAGGGAGASPGGLGQSGTIPMSLSQQSKSMLGSSTANFGPQGSPILVPMSPLPGSQRPGTGLGQPGSFGQLHSQTPTGSHPQFFYQQPSNDSSQSPPIVPPIPGGGSGLDNINSGSLSSDHPSSGSIPNYMRPTSQSTASNYGPPQPTSLQMTPSYASYTPRSGALDSINMPSTYKPLGTPALSASSSSGQYVPSIPPVIPPIPPPVPDLPPALPPAIPALPPVPDLPPPIPDPIPAGIPMAVPVPIPIVSPLQPSPKAQPQQQPQQQQQQASPNVPAPIPAPMPASAPAVPAPIAVDPNSIPKNWRTAKAPDGVTYYYNKITKLTMWDPPECLLMP